MAGQGGISGPAVGMATAGAFLLYIGIQGVSIRDGLKTITTGKLPKGQPKGSGAIEAAEAAASGAGLGSGAAPGTSGAAGSGPNAKVATAARRYLGVPYVWGGTTPTGLDCSGLVVLAFRDAYGVVPPRTTYTQVAWRARKKIDRSSTSAGDLLFWPAAGAPSHVGIAIDADTVIHAPRPGKKVEIVPVNRAFTGGAMPAVYRYTGSRG